MTIKERLALAPELRDTSKWPRPRSVPKDKEELFDRRVAAVEAYLGGSDFKTIEREHRLIKPEVYRLLKRCLISRPDGSITGFFALIPGSQLKAYERKARVKSSQISGASGFAGAFQQLVGEHPELHRFIERAESAGASKSVAQITREVKGAFLKKCEAFRAPNEYPFIVGDQGARALRSYIGKVRAQHLAAAALGVPDSPTCSPRTGQPSGASALRPYEEVELDGHNGDFYFVIKMLGGGGEWIYTLPLRIWLVLMIDRASRAILGYSYRLGGTNYSARDVLRCIAHSLAPWKPKEITLPELDYKPGAGFPSGSAPCGTGRLFDALHVDNAWANVAEAVQDGILESIGATLNVGRAGEPTARPFVERLNQTLENRGFRKLPNGFQAISKADRERAYQAASAYPVTIDELEQILDIMIASYNAEPHSQHTNRSPLEFIRRWDASTDTTLRVTDNAEALLQRISQFEEFATVKGTGGRLPFFRFKDAEYTSTRLKQLKSSVGCRVRVVASYLGDSRFVRAFLQLGGQEVDLGVAQAMPPWHETPLTFDQRRLASASRRKGLLPVVEGIDAGGAYLYLQEREAAYRKGAANNLARFGKLPGERPINKSNSSHDARARVRPAEWLSLE